MYIKTFIYGKIPIEFWEPPALFFVIILVFLISGYIKKRNAPNLPQYRFFLWGLWAKIIGGLLFACIYVFHYKGGDTTSYYECGLAFCNLFQVSFGDFMATYLGNGSLEVKSIFTNETGSPMWYMFSDDKTRMVIKILVPLMLLSFKSYFITTVLVAIITYGGLWRLYLMFTRYFPQYAKLLAIGVLFMPSVIFWGSGILKDSFTLAATCYFIVATNDLIIKRGNRFSRILVLLISGFLIVSIKPYILIILLPGTLVWFFYARIKRIRNKFFRYVLVPFIYAIIIPSSFLVLTTLSDSLGKFSPDTALNTAVVIQDDLKQEYYEGNSFDIGSFEATPISVISKFPVAMVAGLYRPFIWESRNVVMILSGLENLFILIITIMVLFAIRWRIIYQLIADYPVILYSFLFSILFAFMIGLTTANFGALVRFKIPLIPLYMASLMIMLGHLRVSQSKMKSGFLR
jgi:hypothetical protein